MFFFTIHLVLKVTSFIFRLKHHVEISVQSESTKENNSVKEKQQERNCSTKETEQNDKVYEKKKKGRLKRNGVIVLK